MKRSTNNSSFYLMIVSLSLITCCTARKDIRYNKPVHNINFISERYNHFEGGVLFTNIEVGLSVLWKASFKYGRAYKENLGFFLRDGLLILPNKYNTVHTSRYSALLVFTRESKLFVEYNGRELEVMAIVHTHPDKWGIHAPSPGSDYQFGYLGIHNYIISNYDLFDAYFTIKGEEIYARLGDSNSYFRIPLIGTATNTFAAILH